MATHKTRNEQTTVVVAFPTEDAAERFIYLLQQLAELRGSAVMRLLPITVAIKRCVEPATAIHKQPGEQRTAPAPNSITLEDLNLSEEEMRRFADGARFLFEGSDGDRANER